MKMLLGTKKSNEKYKQRDERKNKVVQHLCTTSFNIWLPSLDTHSSAKQINANI